MSTNTAMLTKKTLQENFNIKPKIDKLKLKNEASKFFKIPNPCRVILTEEINQ